VSQQLDYFKKYEPIFGEWKIVKEIGHGSFGTVFEIERNDFGRTYKAALKAITIPQSDAELQTILSNGHTEDSAKEYLLDIVNGVVNEFSLMSELKGHTNIVGYEDHKVYPHENGMGWDILIRMELLTPLNSYIKEKGTLSDDEVIALGKDICRALELCGKRNIIHRDIKPENIFVNKDGDFKLGDFGIARHVEKTQSGLTKIGTINYMAPEIYKGDSYNSTVDTYSLGIVMYKLLNNNRPMFVPAFPKPDDIDRAFQKRLHGDPRPMPEGTSNERLSYIILKACSYDPKERYATAAEMRKALENIDNPAFIIPRPSDILDDRTIVVTPPPQKDDKRTNPLPIIIPLIIILLLGAAALFLMLNRGKDDPQRENADTDVIQAAKVSEDTETNDGSKNNTENTSDGNETPEENNGEDANEAPEENNGENTNEAPEENNGENTNEDPKGNSGENVDEDPEINNGENVTEDSDVDNGENINEAPEENNGENTNEDPEGNSGENTNEDPEATDVEENDNTATEPVEERKKNPVPENAAEDACGEDLTWRFDEETATLYIEGEGDMWDFVEWDEEENDYYFVDRPWENYDEQIESVEISDSVTSIGYSAFYYCSSLTSIDIPDSVTSIWDRAFYDCDSLTSIEIPDSVTSIGDYAFSNCSSLTSIVIPDSVTSIGDSAFLNCYSLTSIEIPDSVTSIGYRAFTWCTSLTNIDVSNRNKIYSDISGVLFDKDKKTIICYPAGKKETSYTIPNSVTSIGDYAFSDCDSLTSIEIPDSVTSIGDSAFYSCDSLTSIEIPDSVTSIENGAFFNCSSLTSIDIPDSVTSIGDLAFLGCTSLTSIDIPDSVTSIGYYAFSSCSSLTSIDIPDSVTSIGDRAFSYCNSLTSIDIPDSVTSIGDDAFSYCSSLTSIEIPNSVTSIGDRAFSSCDSLTSIDIPDNVTSIGNSAFFGCDSLETINFAGSKEQWQAFGLASYEISGATVVFGKNPIPEDAATNACGENLTWYFDEETATLYIEGEGDMWDFSYQTGEYSWRTTQRPWFASCEDIDDIKNIVIKNGVTSIGNSAFSSFSSLESIEIPDSMTSIGHDAFFYCETLTSIEIPDSITQIGRYAFNCCKSLKSIEMPDSVTYIGAGAFDSCNSLESIIVNKNNKYYCDRDGILFNKDMTEIVCYPAGKLNSQYQIPDSVTFIGDYAFSDCGSLTSIDIPDSVISIGDFAFCLCNSLTSIDLPDSVASIGIRAFNQCSSLTSIDIPGSVTFIGDYAFHYCDSLTSIDIPDSVTSIGYSAFSLCDSLETINFSGTKEQWQTLGLDSDDINNATVNFAK